MVADILRRTSLSATMKFGLTSDLYYPAKTRRMILYVIREHNDNIAWATFLLTMIMPKIPEQNTLPIAHIKQE